MSELSTIVDSLGDGRGGRRSLLVVAPDGTFSRPLPEVGTVTVGRAETADVRLSDPLASRHHARLFVTGEGMQVEDLGSANGTKVREARIDANAPVPLAPGEAVVIGSTILMVRESLAQGRPRRAWPHAYFEARLEEACAQESRAPHAAVRLHVDAPIPPADVCEAIAPALRAADVLAVYGPGEYELLFPDTPPELAQALAQDLRVRLEGQGVPARVGIACFPRDGRTPELLISLAGDRVRGLVPGDEDAGAIVVEDPAMQRAWQLAERAAPGAISVLIIGETGVGKEIMAEAIHRLSPRARAQLLCLNCASLSESLLESELFGHERGAFTGATDAKPGLLETAPGGTVFLDEMGEMPLALQAKLLRVIETRQVTRVGGLKARSIDVRFVAATNRNLDAEVKAGRFRQDLYFRLNGITLQIPPLRERVSEILPLARRFLGQFAQQLGRKSPPLISAEAEALLLRHTWPGNIRELRNMMERATLLCVGGEITAEHLPVENMNLGPAPAAPAPAASGEETERDRIVRVLAECAGNQSRAARRLGIARSTLIEKIELHEIPRPRKPAL